MISARATPPVTEPLTIAIPFYSGVDYLREAVESVRRQTDTEWKLAVLDDGPDATVAAVVAGFGDHRITYRRNPTRLGMAGNWNACLDAADTDLVALLHADDVMLPDYVARMRAAARSEPNAAVTFCWAETIDARGRRVFSVPDVVKRLIAPRASGVLRLEGRRGVESLARGNFLYCPTACYRKSLLGSRRFADRWKFVLDLQLFVDILLAGGRLTVLPGTHYAYRRHATSATAKYTEDLVRFSEEFAFLDELAARATERRWFAAARHARQRRIHRLSLGYCALADVLRGRLGRAWTEVLGCLGYGFPGVGSGGGR